MRNPTRLTMKQCLFLDARRTAASDEEARTTAGVSLSTLKRWKASPEFRSAYGEATTLGEAVDSFMDREDKQQLVTDQTEALMTTLPGVVQEHIRIALGAEKEADRLRAIEKLYSAVGFGKDESPPMSKQNQTFMRILNLMTPQVTAEALRRGLPVSSTMQEVVAENFSEVLKRLEREEKGEEGE